MIGAAVVVTRWGRELERTIRARDVDRAVAGFAPDAVLEFGGTSSMAGTFTGAAEIRSWYQRWFARMRDVSPHVGRVAVSRPWALGLTNTVMVELAIDETTLDGLTVHVDALAVFDVVRGQVLRQRTYLLDETPELALWGHRADGGVPGGVG